MFDAINRSIFMLEFLINAAHNVNATELKYLSVGFFVFAVISVFAVSKLFRLFGASDKIRLKVTSDLVTILGGLGLPNIVMALLNLSNKVVLTTNVILVLAWAVLLGFGYIPFGDTEEKKVPE